MRLAQRPIFVGLRRKRIEPAFDVALLDRLLKARLHVDAAGAGSYRLRTASSGRNSRWRAPRHISAPPGSARRPSRRLSGTDRVSGHWPGRRRWHREAAPRSWKSRRRRVRARRRPRPRRSRLLVVVIAARQSCAAQGKAEGRADPFMLLMGRLNAASRQSDPLSLHRLSLPACSGSRRPFAIVARGRSASLLVTG